MNRTELSGPVLVTGLSAFGRETSCVLEPVREPGIHVKLPTGDTVPLSDMTLGVNRLLHFLTLKWGKFVLRVPEHLLGLTFNLGLDGVLITARRFRLPYDGRAQIFWDAIRPALRQSGSLEWLTVPAPLIVNASPGLLHKDCPCRARLPQLRLRHQCRLPGTRRSDPARRRRRGRPERASLLGAPLLAKSADRGLCRRLPECWGGRMERSPSRSRPIRTRPRRLCSRSFAGIACWTCSARSWPCLRKAEELPDRSSRAVSGMPPTSS